MESTASKHLNEQELLKLAAAWEVERVGRHRNEDGTVPGWHEWARSHSQSDDAISICRGRSEWQHALSKESSNKHQNTHVSVVSWNILSDTWLQMNILQGHYAHTSPQESEWSFRLGLLLDWIERLSPAILALQEVDYDKFTADIFPELQKRGYEGQMQTPKKKAAKQPCGNATFWKRALFQMKQHASFSRCFCLVLECLQSKESVVPRLDNSPVICICNAHLESSQSEVGSDRRARQLNSALSWAAYEASNTGMIVCGDCNTGADSQLSHVLREHHWHGHTFSSVYEHPATLQTLPVSMATFMIPGHHYAIDHMWYAQGTLRLLCALDAFSTEETEEHVHSKGKECGFPSAFCPSDHIPIGAVFGILPQALDHAVSSGENFISQEREAELKQQWQALQLLRSMQSKGKPSPEQLAERRKYAAAVKAWKYSVQSDPVELEFITKLIKDKK